jgi:hypothetical protein
MQWFSIVRIPLTVGVELHEPNSLGVAQRYDSTGGSHMQWFSIVHIPLTVGVELHEPNALGLSQKICDSCKQPKVYAAGR